MVPRSLHELCTMLLKVRALRTGITSFASRSFATRSYISKKHRHVPFHAPIPRGVKLNPFSKKDRRKLSPGLYPVRQWKPELPKIPEPVKPAHFEAAEKINNLFFVGPGVYPEDVTAKMVVPESNIVIGPYAREHEVREVEFVKSSFHVEDCPNDNRPEFAFFGGPNVGKSSLFNALVGQKELAPISKTPGKTDSIDHYLINKKYFFVDTPGYVHAKRFKPIINWSKFTMDFFILRPRLAGVLFLIDSNLPLEPRDLECVSWLGRLEIQVSLVFTKCDKLKGDNDREGPMEFLRELKEVHGKKSCVHHSEFRDPLGKKYSVQLPWIMTSDRDGTGINDLRRHIAQLRNYWNERHGECSNLEA